MHYTYLPKGVCSVKIDFEINDDVISDVAFTAGCNGNLKAISKLVDGMKVDDIERILLGNTCGMKGTACADQFAKAVREASDSMKG